MEAFHQNKKAAMPSDFSMPCENCQIVYDLLQKRDEDIFALRRKNQIQENTI